MPANDALLHNWFYGNYSVRLVACIGFAFLMGSIPVGPVTTWMFSDLHPRLARAAAGLVPVINALKAFVPTAIAGHGGGESIGLYAAAAALIGHCFCPWRRFNGGTGVAVEAGVLLALCWPAALAYVAIWCVAALSSNYAVVGSLLASAFVIVSLWFFLGPSGALLALLMLLVVASRQRASFVRLSEGREPLLVAPRRARPSVARGDRQAVESV